MGNTYIVVNYADVFGNRCGGYDINLEYECGEITFPSECNKKEMCSLLEINGFLKTHDMRKITIEDCGSFFEIMAKKDKYPLFRLEKR